MHKKAPFLTLVFTLLTLFAKAQSGDDARGVVMYDPLFWRHELRIKPTQARIIEQINREFYAQLLTAYQSQPDDESYLSGKVVENTKIRNQKILDAFAPHQRKKWQKIQLAYAD